MSKMDKADALRMVLQNVQVDTLGLKTEQRKALEATAEALICADYLCWDETDIRLTINSWDDNGRLNTSVMVETGVDDRLYDYYMDSPRTAKRQLKRFKKIMDKEKDQILRTTGEAVRSAGWEIREIEFGLRREDQFARIGLRMPLK